ncbi:MAG: hypothetical protein BWX50_00817 [Euryarchaeota archaeon ADurb.Bin009]|nr:MAG: hypothetical protein BWX50_00817 [Euryarchaeota archaeon ADurb.Bin009]
MGVDNLLAATGGHGPDDRVIVVLGVRIDQDILQFLFREELRHRFGQHRFAGPGGADHHHVPALDRCLPDHLDGMFLTDDLIDEIRGYIDI